MHNSQLFRLFYIKCFLGEGCDGYVVKIVHKISKIGYALKVIKGRSTESQFLHLFSIEKNLTPLIYFDQVKI